MKILWLFASLALPAPVAAGIVNHALGPKASDAIQYVSTNGNDSYDGLTWGTAKATIPAAYDALPSCKSDDWPHCGVIHVAAGVYTVTSPIDIASPYVSIEGVSPWATQIHYTGATGCAIVWKEQDYYGANMHPVNLADISIDGTNAGAGTCGLNTIDVGSFRANRVAIKNFPRPGSSGLLETFSTGFSERWNVSMSFANDATAWEIEGGAGQSGYPYSNSSVGYGNYHMWINTTARGQVGVHFDNHVEMLFSDIQLIENMVPWTTAVELTNGSHISSCLINWHFEGGTTGISENSTSYIKAVGTFQESAPMTDSIPAQSDNYIMGYQLHLSGGSPSPVMGDPWACGTSTARNYICGSHGNSPLAVGYSGTTVWELDNTGNIRLPQDNNAFLISAGTIRFTRGTGSHTFAHAYGTAPVCTATDTTHPAAAIQVTASTTAVTVTLPGGTSVDAVAWICTPSAN